MLAPTLTEKDLKSQLIKELDRLNREQLLTAHQFVSRLIVEELIKGVTQDWEAGKVNRTAIQKAIDQFRDRRPYETAQP